MKYLVTFLIISLGLFNTEKQPTEKKYTLTITINNVKDSSGSVGVALFDESSEFPDGEIFNGAEKSLKSGGSIEIIIEDVPAGDYAIAAMHDSNDSAEIDMNSEGMPTEGFGFSNNAMGDMGPPSFDQAAFTVDGDKELEVNLIYLLGRYGSSK